jgi:hypothetical protein
MIQRKQSIYLLLVTIMMSFLLIRPYAEIVLMDGKYLVFHSLEVKMYTTANEISNYRYTIPLFLVVFAAGALSFVNIFFYNRRILQIRLCIINYFLLISMLVIMVIYYFTLRSEIENTRHVFRVAGVYPILGFVMNLLAYRAIQQDELLVSSYNRLR